MSTREHVQSVVASLQPVIDGVPDEELGAPTPCTEFDLRMVANHMLGTVEAMRRVGASEPMDPEDPWGTNGDNMRAEWRDDLTQRLNGYAEAWGRPEAWQGEAMGGAMTKEGVGDLGFVEVILHGWDLAKSSGQEVDYDDAAVGRALEILDQIAEVGRAHGAFGPEVSVPDDAEPFAKVLAKAGRDPEWSAE
jgi:uncharacterized protein (TIGR03086 family)